MFIFLSKSAADFYSRASPALQRRLDRCFGLIQGSPRHHPNIRPLTGKLKGFWRYRIGDWRIVYSVDDQRGLITVSNIEKRGEVYD